MDLPQFQARPDSTRLIFPHVFKLLFLAGVFYGGIYFLTWTLRYPIPNMVNILIMVFLVVLIVMQVLLYHVKFAKHQYLFFSNRVEKRTDKPEAEAVYFSNFQGAEVKRNIFDLIFGTGTVVVNQSVAIGPIPNAPQMKDYIIGLAAYFNQSSRDRYVRPYNQGQQPVQQPTQQYRPPQQGQYQQARQDPNNQQVYQQQYPQSQQVRQEA